MEIPDPDQPNRFAQQLFTPLPDRYDRLAEILSMGQNGRWRRAMVDHIVADRPGLVLDVASGTAGVAIQLADRTGARVVGLDLTLDMLRQGPAQRRRAPRGRTGSSWWPAGPSRRPSTTGRFDALTFTYLLRYVDDPQATLIELARLVKPGGAVASLEFLLPEEPVLAVLVVGVHTAAPSRRRLAHRRKGVVRGGPVPRPQHLGPLPALPGGVDGRGLEAGRLRRRRGAADEPRRGSGHVGQARRCVRPRRPGGPHPEQRPSYYAARPGGWRDWWTLLHPPYTGMAPGLRGHRRLPGADGQRHPAGRHPVGLLLRRRPGRPRTRRAARPTAAHPDTPGRRPSPPPSGSVCAVRSPSGSPGSSRSVRHWCPSSSSGPSWSWATTSSSSGASSTTTSASRPAGAPFPC